MERIGDDKILRHRAGVLEAVRRSVNLETPQRVDEAVEILEEWVRKQPHFLKKNFSRDYLERTIITTKGLVERAKQRIDKLCTIKTLMPEFFTMAPDTKTEFKKLATIIPTVFLPMPSEDHYRINLLRLITDDYDSNDVFIFYKYSIMLAEYLRKSDYSVGMKIIADFRERNILNFITNVNPVLLKHIVTILLDGYGLRLKGIYIVTESKMVGALVSLLKQVLSAKISGRIQVLPDVEMLYKFVPREILPAEYGGPEEPLKVLCDNWIEVLTAAEYSGYFKEMAKAGTNETYRRSDKFNQDYVGTAGTFRTFTID